MADLAARGRARPRPPRRRHPSPVIPASSRCRVSSPTTRDRDAMTTSPRTGSKSRCPPAGKAVVPTGRRPTRCRPTPTTARPRRRARPTHAVLHVSTIALPIGLGDFASGAVDKLGHDDVLIVLFEYDPASVDHAAVQGRGAPEGPDRGRLQPQRAPASDPGPGRRAAVLPRPGPRVLPLRGDRLVRQPAPAREGGERGARHAHHRPARRHGRADDGFDHDRAAHHRRTHHGCAHHGRPDDEPAPTTTMPDSGDSTP